MNLFYKRIVILVFCFVIDVMHRTVIDVMIAVKNDHLPYVKILWRVRCVFLKLWIYEFYEFHCKTIILILQYITAKLFKGQCFFLTELTFKYHWEIKAKNNKINSSFNETRGFPWLQRGKKLCYYSKTSIFQSCLYNIDEY